MRWDEIAEQNTTYHFLNTLLLQVEQSSDNMVA